MQVIDLSHPLVEGMPVFPGTPEPEFQKPLLIEKHGFAESLLKLGSHTGTHVDAPAHMIAGGKHLGDFPLSAFIGPGLVLDLRALPPGPVEHACLEDKASVIARADFLLLLTSWSRHWGRPDYFRDYPVLSPAAAQWLTGFKLKGIGVDAISVDAHDAARYEVHRTLLAADILIVENLTSLDQLVGRDFIFSCLPLSLPEADGCPVRAAALLAESPGKDCCRRIKAEHK